jgi:hypothetical protein
MAQGHFRYLRLFVRILRDGEATPPSTGEQRLPRNRVTRQSASIPAAKCFIFNANLRKIDCYFQMGCYPDDGI